MTKIPLRPAILVIEVQTHIDTVGRHVAPFLMDSSSRPAPPLTLSECEREILALLGRVVPPSITPHPGLVRLLHDCFASLTAGKSYFPLSLIRETGRRFLDSVSISDHSRLVFLCAQGDAALMAMARSNVKAASSVARKLETIVRSADQRDSDDGTYLRLHYLDGLRHSEFPLESLRASAAGCAMRLEPPMLGLRTAMEGQNLRPRGEITTILEKVRDGRKSLIDALAAQAGHLGPMAHNLLRMERRGISVGTGDLVNEAILRLRKLREAPLNGLMLQEEARRIMKQILVDRARRKTPGGGKHKGELIDERRMAAPQQYAMFDATPLGIVLREEVLIIADQVLAEMKRLGNRGSDVEIVRSRWFDGTGLMELAQIHGVSLSTVRRLVASAGEIFIERYQGGVQPARTSARESAPVTRVRTGHRYSPPPR